MTSSGTTVCSSWQASARVCIVCARLIWKLWLGVLRCSWFFFFWPHCEAHGILVLQLGTEPRYLAVKAWSPNHQGTSKMYFLKNYFHFIFWPHWVACRILVPHPESTARHHGGGGAPQTTSPARPWDERTQLTSWLQVHETPPARTTPQISLQFLIHKSWARESIWFGVKKFGGNLLGTNRS